MENKSHYDSDLKDIRLILFGFELNQIQKIILLTLSLMGLFIIPYLLSGLIFFNLFQSIFIAIPAYLSDPIHYADLYLFYAFAPVIWDIVESSLLLYLSIYGLRKILRPNSNTKMNRRKIIQQDRIINWFGFKLSSGQAFFIYSLSLVGIIFTTKLLVYASIFSHGLFDELCWIPDSPVTLTSHLILLENIPIIICSIFYVLCIYSLIITKRGNSRSPNIKNVKSYRILIFIPSIVIILLYLMRIFCHLFLFTDFAYLFGSIPEAGNYYQFLDLINIIIIITICLILITLCYSYKEKSPKTVLNSNGLTWFHINLNSNRVICLLSLGITYGVFFGFLYILFMFLWGLMGPQIMSYIAVPILVLCGYTIRKLLKNQRFDYFIKSIDNSDEIITRWFKFPLDKLNSVIFLSVSSGVAIILIYQFLTTQMNIQYMLLTHSFEFSSAFWFISLGCMLISIVLIITLVIYTVKKTILSIKSRE